MAINFLAANGFDHTPVSAVNPLPTTDAATGDLDDAAWDGTGNPASLIALWKGIYAQLAIIATNTET
jgi:hypothetical protein